MQAAEARSKGSILVVDDEERIRDAVRRALERVGYQVDASADAGDALDKMTRAHPDMVICDIRMPAMDGLSLLDRIKEQDPGIMVMMITGYASIESAVDAVKRGAHEYLAKPFSPGQLRLLVDRAFERRRLVEENLYLKAELDPMTSGQVVMGRSPAMVQLFELVAKVARTDSSVLITGESGSGKEVIARLIHFQGARANAPFVTVNCSAIPKDLLESELFGHKRGAFTGAFYTKRGSFEQADGGTFFLDEIGDMRLEMQAKILRVLEEKKIRQIGSEAEKPIDVRVIAATNKELGEEIAGGRFREDLFYRLNVVHVAIPPLRRHKEDIALYARHFLKLFCREMKKPETDFSDDALELMERHDWPGNVRELRNAVERAVIFAMPGDRIRTAHFPPELRQTAAAAPSAAGLRRWKTLRTLEIDYIREVLEACGGNKMRAAEILDISASTIWRKLQEDPPS